MRTVAFERALRLAGYNRPLYAFGGAVALAAVAVGMTATSPLLRALAFVTALGASWFLAASFLAFHWMFDRSELTRWGWLADEVGEPARWVQIHAGLEEASAPADALPRSEGMSLDVYDPADMTEPAIAQARRRRPVAATPARFDALPVADGWANAVVAILVAHEIRDPARRRRFFAELARILADDGTLVLVEHLRDLPALLAFGPGVLHFLPRSEWLRRGPEAGLRLVRERRITPFVRVFVFGKTAAGPT